MRLIFVNLPVGGLSIVRLVGENETKSIKFKKCRLFHIDTDIHSYVYTRATKS